MQGGNPNHEQKGTQPEVWKTELQTSENYTGRKMSGDAKAKGAKEVPGIWRVPTKGAILNSVGKSRVSPVLAAIVSKN